METDINYNFIIDPEYSWLIQTCMNAFNVGLTMLHLTVCDYMRELRMDDDNFMLNALSYPLFMAAVDIIMYANL